MELSEITKSLLTAKKAKGLSFTDLEKVLERDEVWIAAVFYRQASASPDEAKKLVAALGLAPDMADALTQFPLKGLGPTVPTDPLIYRFYEQVSGWIRLGNQPGNHRPAEMGELDRVGRFLLLGFL